MANIFIQIDKIHHFKHFLGVMHGFSITWIKQVIMLQIGYLTVRNAPCFSENVAFFGQFWTKMDIKWPKKSFDLRKKSIHCFSWKKISTFCLRYCMIIYATIKKNQFETASTAPKRIKRTKNSNPLTNVAKHDPIVTIWHHKIADRSRIFAFVLLKKYNCVNI